MNDEKMEVDESARNIEFRKSVEVSESKGLQKRGDVTSEDESVNNIKVNVPQNDSKPSSAKPSKSINSNI